MTTRQCARDVLGAGEVADYDLGADRSQRIGAIIFSSDERANWKAALAKRKSQSTFARPRSFTFRIQAIVLSHPNAGSIRGRACRLFA